MYLLAGALVLAIVIVIYLLEKLRHSERERAEIHLPLLNLEEQLDASALKNEEVETEPRTSSKYPELHPVAAYQPNCVTQDSPTY